MSDNGRLKDLLRRWQEVGNHEAGARTAVREELLRELLLCYEEGKAGSAEELCPPDLLPDLQELIETLIAYGKLFEPTPQDETPLAPAPSVATTSRYLDLRFHDGGGLGDVFLARDEESERIVAIKFMQKGCAADAKSRDRFFREGNVTRQLEHPNIVSVYGSGEGPDRRPFYVMRFVQGTRLDKAIKKIHQMANTGDYLAERNLALRELMTRFVTVCKTVGYAHSKGVLHRDLKPANIMLGDYGETFVIDWGLAKLLGRSQSDAENPFKPVADEERDTGKYAQDDTQWGIGTRAYMSPEQAAGEWHRVGPASDIYSLGATFFHLLTGGPPTRYSRETTEKKRGDAAEPLSRGRGKKHLPLALEEICLKAMAPKPEDRYGTAVELASDVEHWLADEPVSVPEPLTVKMGRWMRRHKPLVSGAAVAVLMGLIVGTAGIIWEVKRQAEADRKQAQLDAAEVTRLDNEAKRLAAAKNEAQVYAYYADMNLIKEAMAKGDVRRAREPLSRYAPGTGLAHLRCFEWYLFWHQCHLEKQTLSRQGGEKVTAVAIAGDGKAFAWGDYFGTVVLYKATNDKLEPFPNVVRSPITSLAFSSDQKRLVALGFRGELTVLDLKDNTYRPLSGQAKESNETIMCVSFAPDDDNVLVSVSRDRTVRKWDLANNAAPFPLPKMDNAKLPDVLSIAVSVKRNVYVTGHRDGSIKLWDLKTGQELHENARKEHLHLVHVALSANGNTIASASTKGTIKVWDRQTGTEKATLLGHTQGVTSLVVSADDRILVSASTDKTVRIWDLATGHERSIFRGHEGRVRAVDLSTDGKLLLSGSEDKTVKLWDAEKRSGFSLIKGTDRSRVDFVAFALDGTLVWGGSKGQTLMENLKLWNCVTGEEQILDKGDRGMVQCVAVLPDGTLVTGGRNAVKLWDVKTGKSMPLQSGKDPIPAIAISPDGKTLAWGATNGTATLWNIENRKILRVLGERGRRVNSVAFSPDGKILATARGTTVMLWDVDEVRLLFSLAGLPPRHEGDVRAVAWTPDGKTLVSGGDDGTLRVWDVETRKERAILPGLDEIIFSVACASDGKTVVTGGMLGNVGTVRLWDLTAGQERERLTLHESQSAVSSVAIAKDGRRLAAGCHDGALLLWEAATDQQVNAVIR